MNTNWIRVEDKLPEEGKYVLARHNRGTWSDRSDQDNVNCVVVKLVKGISKEDRKLMREGKRECEVHKVTNHIGIFPTKTVEIPRHKITQFGDEQGNNTVPYQWNSFGPDSFFGQSITHWMPIPPLNKW